MNEIVLQCTRKIPSERMYILLQCTRRMKDNEEGKTYE